MEIVNIGNVSSIDINQEMRKSFLDYAMSVIVSRALPDARDGLKPVHRRILYAMYDMGIRHTSPHRKSARIVGEVLGKYHPHGDQSVYAAMARMAQNFSMRYMLVDGQGNFGSVDGDSPAAMRYTEARLAKLTSELLEDIDKDTIDFTPNFDDSLVEPTVLPARLPNLLLNGTTGIAVGMATNIPPHNLTELCNAVEYLIDNQANLDDVTVDDLMQFVSGPDFPTGGIILGNEGIKQAFATGKGRVVVRSVAEIEDNPNSSTGRQRINVTELPFMVNKSNLVEKIAELVRAGRLTDISDLRDESDRNGISLIIELKRGTQPRKALNQLFKHTSLQTVFSIQMLALVNNEPRLLSLKRALQIYIDHRIEVIIRRTKFDLEKAEKRQHILQGLLIALDHLDDVIETIRRSSDADEARSRLVEQFGLSEAQASAILDMQLRRLAALERQKIDQEHADISLHIDYLNSLLMDNAKVLSLIKEDIISLREQYGDERRSKIMLGFDGSLNEEDLIPDEDVLISISARGYIKRTPVAAYRLQQRGGKGLIGAGKREEDLLEHLFAAGSLNSILYFSNQGKVYSEKAYAIPEYDRTARGNSLMNILPLSSDEKITAALPIHDFEEGEYLTMITKKGRIKRVALSDFANVRANGKFAITLDDQDELGWVKMSQGKQDILLISQNGKGIRFNEEDVRVMGRSAAGVNAIRLSEGDLVAGADMISEEEGSSIFLITEKGMGKRTPLDEYRRQGRYGQGVRAMVLELERTGKIMGARIVKDDDEITCITTKGIILRIPAETVSLQSRITQGVRIMDLRASRDTIASMAVIREGSLSQVPSEADDDAEVEIESVMTE